MSKVYEALRQKQQESQAGQVRGKDTSSECTLTCTAFLSDMELAPEVRQVLDTVEEENAQCKVKATPDIESVPSIGIPAPAISPNGFRRLKVPYRESSRLVFQTDPHGLAAEQFRFLRRTLEQKFPHGGTVLITSPAPKDGKTLTAANLSACLADSGRPTLLLEADIRQPSIQRLLGAKIEEPGIEAVLAGTAEPGSVIHFVEPFSVHVAMVKAPPDDPSHLVSGKGLQQVLVWARSQFAWVVIDSPPVLPAADVTQLVTLADAVLLVIRAQSTPRDLATRAIELLGNHLSGVILNEATIESNPYYRYLADYRQKRASSQSETEA